MTAVEAWCGVTGDDCYPTGTELRWMFAFLVVVAVLIFVRSWWKGTL